MSDDADTNGAALRKVSELPQPAQQALAAYRARFDAAADRASAAVTVAWAPGRINLIGEHTDYNDGLVLPVAVDRVVALAGRAVPGDETRCYSLHHDQRVSLAHPRTGALEAVANPPLWSRYISGVLAELAALPVSAGAAAVTPAFDAALAGDVPLGGGMSSSAALEVAVATFAAAIGGPALDPLSTAKLCQRAEQAGTGAQVGILDQAASCLGRADHALLLDCRDLAYEYIPVHLPGVLLAVYDTGVAHSNATSGYNQRRRECEDAVRLLARAIAADAPERSIAALRDITEDDLLRYGGALPETLLRRARHVVSENARVLAAVDALRARQVDALGALLFASHASLRDDYAVSCAELNVAVEIARGVPGVIGARMMGGGFGGSALILVQVAAQPALAAAFDARYTQQTGRVGSLHVCQIAGGPQHVSVDGAL